MPLASLEQPSSARLQATWKIIPLDFGVNGPRDVCRIDVGTCAAFAVAACAAVSQDGVELAAAAPVVVVLLAAAPLLVELVVELLLLLLPQPEMTAASRAA